MCSLYSIVSGIWNISYTLLHFLVSVFHPLVGNNIHTINMIKNSEDFVQKLESVQTSLTREMVDMSTLFISIPLDKTIQVTRRELQGDTDFAKSCELAIQHLMDLLEFCLNVTYLVCW